MKNLIVYYSYEGNCEILANEIHKVIPSDIIKLQPKNESKTKSLSRFIYGGIQVYIKKRPKLEKYDLDIEKYDNIIILSPCWYGTFSPYIKTFLHENKIKNKNIYLLVSNGGNLRHTWDDYEKALKGNNIKSKFSIVYPIKNGIEDSIKKNN